MSRNEACVRQNVRIISAAIIAALVLALSLFVAITFNSKAQADDYQSVQAEIDAMAPELDALSVKHDDAVAEANNAREAVVQCDNEINELNKQKEKNTKHLLVRARQMYRGGGAPSMLGLLLGAQNFEEFATGFEMLMTMNQEDAYSIKRGKELKQQTAEKREEKAEQLEVATSKAEEAAALKANAQATINGLQAKLNALDEQQKAARAAAMAAEEQASKEQASGGGSGGGGGSDVPVTPGTGNAAIYQRAVEQVGKIPYVWGGCSPSGCDCSGFVSHCCTGGWSRIGTAAYFASLPRVSNPAPGNIAANGGHCGVYAGGGQMIHAPQEGEYVKYGPVQGGMVITQY